MLCLVKFFVWSLDCEELEDATFKLFSYFEVGYMQACRVAAALGDYHFAEQYAKATLRGYTNPVHNFFARLRLGRLAAVRQSMGSEDEA